MAIVIPICRSFDGHAVSVVSSIPIYIKCKGIRSEFIIHIQNRTAVRSNNYAGIGVPVGIRLPAFPCFIRNRRIICINSTANCTAARSRVVDPERGFCTGIVILFKHVDNVIVDGISLPFCIESGISINSHSAAGFLGQALIQIPPCEGVAVTGRHRAGDCLRSAIRHCYTADIAAAVGFIGKLEALAGVIDRQFLLRLAVKP